MLLGMPLPQQELAFVPMQLRLQPALPGPFADLQRLVQMGQALFNLPCDLTCAGQQGSVMGHPLLRSGGAVSDRSAAQKRYPLCHIAIFDLDPPAIYRSLRAPVRKSMLSRERDQLGSPLIQGYVVSGEPKRNCAERQ